MAAIPLEFLTKLVQSLTSPCIQGNAHSYHAAFGVVPL